MISRKKLVIIITIIITISAVIFVYLRVSNSGNSQFSTNNSDNTKAGSEQFENVKKITRILATGDTIGHDSLNLNAKNGQTYSYSKFLEQMKPVLESGDIRFCNQSTLIGGEKFPITGYPSFNAPESLANDMAGAGCNLINTASNHSYDKNQDVIDSNVDIWSSIPGMLGVAGQNRNEAEKNAVKYFEIDGLKYAFLAYTTYSNNNPLNNFGVNMYSREFVSAQVNEAKQAGAKFIITSMRWGTEYSPVINASQTEESQYLADLGVSLVLGHGPHVLEPVKRLQGSNGNETVVWYSLGNFLQTQLEAEALFSAVAVIDVEPETAQLTSLGYLPIYMHYDWTPEEAASEDLLKRTNLKLVPVESAQELFANSRLQTTLEEQQMRISSVLNKFTSVKLLKLSDFGQ